MCSGRSPSVDVAADELAGPDAPAVLARLRGRAPVVWLPSLDLWLITSHGLALDVMRDDVRFTVADPRFTTARVVGASMLSTDGSEHRRHRRPFAPAFRAADLEARFGSEVERLAHALVAELRPRGRGDLRTDVAGPLSVGVIAHALGLRAIDPATVIGWYRAIVAAVTELSAGRAPDGAGPVAVGEIAVGEVGAAVRAALRASRPSVLASARSSLADDEIVSNAAVMMFGGIETTEGMIATLFGHLLGGAGWAALIDDRSLLPAAIEESLRLEPAAAVVDRYAVGDVSLSDARIMAGDLVRVSLAAANRDPAVFDRPDDFALDRANNRLQLAFARGPHACIAMDLARMEAAAAVRAAVRQLPGLRLDDPVTVDGLVFRKPVSVHVTWDADAAVD